MVVAVRLDLVRVPALSSRHEFPHGVAIGDREYLTADVDATGKTTSCHRAER